jgi:hypothetical protein
MNTIHKLVLSLVICLAIACKDKSPQQPTTPATTTEDSTTGSFMPVADLIKQDIKHTDSFAGGILNKRTINGKKDSVFIQPADFHRIANQFLLPELDSASFRQNFTESSLMDESSQLLNFIYTAKNADHPLQKVMVYIKPSLTTDKVTRIYMERNASSGDTLVQQKFTWKMEEYFYILTIRQPKTGPAVTSMDKVIWDAQLFAE